MIWEQREENSSDLCSLWKDIWESGSRYSHERCMASHCSRRSWMSVSFANQSSIFKAFKDMHVGMSDLPYVSIMYPYVGGTKASLINVLRICFIFSASPWPPSQLAPPRDQNDGVLRSLLSIWRFKMFKAVASAVLTRFSSLARSSASASDEGRTTNAHGFHNVVVQYCLCTLRFSLHAEIKRIPIASWKCLTRRCLNLVNPLHHVRARSVWYQAKFNRPPPDNVDGDRIACLTISHTLPMDHCLF